MWTLLVEIGCNRGYCTKSLLVIVLVTNKLQLLAIICMENTDISTNTCSLLSKLNWNLKKFDTNQIWRMFAFNLKVTFGCSCKAQLLLWRQTFLILTFHSFTTAWQVVLKCLQTSWWRCSIVYLFTTNFTLMTASKLEEPLMNWSRNKHLFLLTNVCQVVADRFPGLWDWGLKMVKRQIAACKHSALQYCD